MLTSSARIRGGGTGGGGSGTVTSITAGTGLSGGTITTSGTISLTSPVIVTLGGTGTTTAFTQGSVIFAGASGVYSQNNNNFYFQNSATTPTILATNTSVALSLNTGGDFTGTDAVNIYAQFDAYLPNSAITNSLTGLNTDGAFPGYTTSSSRGTGASPIQLNANDLVGGFFGFGAQGASSPSYQNLGGMAIITTGASTNNLGGELDFYTKGDGGALAKQMYIENGGNIHMGVLGAGTTNAAVGGVGLEIVGTNNTVGGVNLILDNTSNGTSAFTSVFLQNDLAIPAGTHYGQLGMNSSTYSDTTFGTALAFGNQMALTNTDGSILIGAFTSSKVINFIIGGSATTNEIGRFTNTGFNLGFVGGSTGVLNMKGTTSGIVSIQSQAAAGTYNFNLPTTAGTAGQVLTSQGGAGTAMTWTTAGGTGTVTSVATDSTLTGGPITTTGTLGINLTTANIWTGAPTISTVPLTISGNQSQASWTTLGTQLSVRAASLTNTTSSGTVATIAANAFGIPTNIASSATTYTNAATVYIAGAPVASTNVTQTNSYALIIGAGGLNVAGGNSVFGAAVTMQSTLTIAGSLTAQTGFVSGTNASNANLATASGSNAVTSSTAGVLFAGASSVFYRMLQNATTSSTLTTGVSYGATIIGSSPITTFSSGTHAVLANLVVNPIGTVTNGGATTTNTASLYIQGAGSGGTNNYAFLINSGNTLMNGNLTLGTAGNKINITTGSNASIGTATLSGGTVTVSTTAVTASSIIFLTDATTGALTNIGTPTVGTITAGTSFVINSSNVLDTSNINWHIIN